MGSLTNLYVAAAAETMVGPSDSSIAAANWEVWGSEEADMVQSHQQNRPGATALEPI